MYLFFLFKRMIKSYEKMGPAFNQFEPNIIRTKLCSLKPFEIVPHQKCSLNLHLICIKKCQSGNKYGALMLMLFVAPTKGPA